MDNSPVYLKSIKIYQWIFALFGLTLPPSLYFGGLNPLKRHLIFGTYIVYCAILLLNGIYTSHAHDIIVLESTIEYQLDSITKILSYIINVALVVVYGTMEMTAIWRHKELGIILYTIDLLESELLAQCSRKRPSLKWKLFRVSGICLMFLAVVLMCLNYILIAPVMATHVKVIIMFFIVGMQIKCVEYAVYIQIVYELIDSVLESLTSLKAEIEMYPRSTQGQTLPWSLMRQLMKNQQLLNRVWFLVNRIQQYFAGPILLIFYYNGIAILYTVTWAYAALVYESHHVKQSLRLICILILLGNLLTVCCLTEKCMQKYRSIASRLQTFKLQFQDYHVRMRLWEYSMQMVHQNLKFTCNDYMDVDFKSFGKMILALAAYIIVLVQFKIEDDSTGAIIATQKIFGKKPKA